MERMWIEGVKIVVVERKEGTRSAQFVVAGQQSNTPQWVTTATQC